jgi:hypothetical protein
MSIHAFSLALPKNADFVSINTGLSKMTHAFRLVIVLMACAIAASAAPQFRNAGAFLVGETSVNNSVEPGEVVTVRLALKNVGHSVASNLIATLQAGDGVTNIISPSQPYGVLKPDEPAVARDFTFKCVAPTNSLLLVKLELEDSDHSLGMVTFRFRVGPQTMYAINPDSFTINSVGPAEIFPSVLTVTNVPGTIVGVSCTLSNLSHTFPDDLDILLVSPAGDRVLLMSDACGSSTLENVTLTFSDDAVTGLPDDGFPSPLVRPSNFLNPDVFPLPAPIGPYAGVMSAFNGKEANGDWLLFILDDTPDDDGVLDGGWSLTFTTLPRVDSAPTLKFLGGTPNETIRFSVSGRPGYHYAIEGSPDPVNYDHLESFEMPASGTRIFEYQIGPEDKYFRAATDP